MLFNLYTYTVVEEIYLYTQLLFTRGRTDPLSWESEVDV